MNAALRPRVSVILTTSNNATALRYALESVIWQTFVNFEVWVIGDDSRDHSEDVVNSFCDPRIFWFNSFPATKNQFKLINEGMNRARGEYIAYLRDTDLWLPNHLEELIECLQTSEADIAFSITQCIYSDTYSTLNIPLLPGLPKIPDHSSIIHKKNCVYIPLFEEEEVMEYAAKFFRRAYEENLRMDVVPVTTGLKFLWKGQNESAIPQALYMEKLKKDPDFINKQLSAILVRSEQYQRASWTERNLLRWLMGRWKRLMFLVFDKAGGLKTNGKKKSASSRSSLPKQVSIS